MPPGLSPEAEKAWRDGFSTGYGRAIRCMPDADTKFRLEWILAKCQIIFSPDGLRSIVHSMPSGQDSRILLESYMRKTELGGTPSGV